MEENKVFKCAAYIGVFIFIFAVCWFLLSEPDVSNQRERADDVRSALDRAGSEQRNVEGNLERIGRGLDDSIRKADGIAERIGDAESAITASQERRGECEPILADSERRIEESKRIIQAVRARAGQDGK